MDDILVVDNHPLILQYLSELLPPHGYRVLTAENGLAALDRLRSERPRAMIVDLIMPNIDGRTFCRVVRRLPDHADAYLVVLSSVAAENPELVLSCGANAYVAKGPFPRMGETILRVLAEARSREFKGTTDKILGLEDIHAREITRELLALKHHYEVFMESMHEGILEVTSEGRVVYANRSAEAITALPEERLLASELPELFRAEDRDKVRELLAAPHLPGPETGVETQIGERLVELRVNPFAGEAQRAVVVLTDVTERKRYESRLRQAQRLESVGTLAAGVAHDFNNLLMAIQGNVSLMLLDLNPSHPHYARMEEIGKHIQSAKRLTSQLLGYGRRGRYEVSVFNLNERVREIAETFGRARKEITIRLELGEDLRDIEADTEQIEQVLLNLLLNAGDAMPAGGLLELTTHNVDESAIRSDLFTPKPGAYVLLQVRDTGKGMDAQTLERIFEPFFTTKEMGRGSGLGLASVYGSVKGHGGYIEVDSTPGQGSIFRIYLPASSALGRSTAQPPPRHGGEERARTVLVVDDEPAVLKVAQDMLQALQFKVLSADNGSKALSVYEENRGNVELVLLDIVMPGMPGVEVFRKLQEVDPQAKVLLCSGYSIDGEARRLLDMGAAGFIQKPFTLKALSASVERVLKGRR
jgi:two-component system cell cycle sensor histidine kinase/response regulator CckA